jgi:2'-hydroxyisoflavone reductase
MKLLIIGGTRFLGRHLVAVALSRNHEVTLFNRGSRRSPTDVETIKGDRNTDLNTLRGRRWDAVIDTCGYLPRTVRASAQALSDSVDRYVFISSQSAYADFSTCGVDENSPLQSLTNEQIETANNIDTTGQVSAFTYGEMYGGLKALCEEAAEEAMADRVLTIRPGLIVGPYDHTDRFTYWVTRVAHGGEVLAPGQPDRLVQFIDVRDLAEWTVSSIEDKRIGIYNCNGLPNYVTMEALLEECKNVSDSNASFTWVDEKFLLQEEVKPWGEMPLWIPEESAPDLRGFMFTSIDKALNAGLKFRPLSDTILATLVWYKTSEAQRNLEAGIEIGKEKALLRKWHHGFYAH